MASGDRKWIGRAAAAGSIKAVAYHIALTYVLPIGAPIVTGAVGYIQGYPWMYILVAASVTFGGVATGLVRFDEWLARQRVKEKLAFTEVRVGKNIQGEGFSLGVAFISSADVSIEFEIEEISTRLANRVPEKRSFDLRNFIIPPRGHVWFNDHIIDIGTPPKPGTIEGFLECKAQYGRVGHKQYDLSVRKQVILASTKLVCSNRPSRTTRLVNGRSPNHVLPRPQHDLPRQRDAPATYMG